VEASDPIIRISLKNNFRTTMPGSVEPYPCAGGTESFEAVSSVIILVSVVRLHDSTCSGVQYVHE